MYFGRRIERRLPPERGETCCVAHYDSRKIAALLFDKQYIAAESSVAPDEVAFSDSDVQQSIEYLLTHGIQLLPNGQFRKNEEENAVAISLYYANAVQTAFSENGIAVLPVFSNSAQLDGYCPEGPAAAYQSVIDNVPLVDDSSLSWEQVMEFRRDKDAKRKLRDLRIWTMSLNKATTIDEARELISQKLDDYEWAIKKHGIETRMGAYKTVLDVREQVAVVAAAAAGALCGGALWGALAAGATIAGKTLIYVWERRIALREVLRANREVALVCDLKKLSGS